MQSEMDRIMTALAVYYTEEEARQWLNSPHSLLEGQTAAEVIEAGQVNRVWQIIDMLDSGAYI